MAEKVRLFYTLIQDIVTSISLIFSIVYWKDIRNSYLKLFPFYTAFALMVTITWYVKEINFIGRTLQNLFILFEFFIFYNFYFQIFHRKRFYKILFLFIAIFIIALVFIITFRYAIKYHLIRGLSLLNKSFSEI